VIGTSDGGGRPHTADRHETSTQLLGHWVREQQVMPLEEAVYRLTGKTALMHDITDRGFIAAGKVADITIFDPDTIAPKPRDGAVRERLSDRCLARPDHPRPALPERTGVNRLSLQPPIPLGLVPSLSRTAGERWVR